MWGDDFVGVGDMEKKDHIMNFIFFNTTIHNFITILCHVGCTILQVV